jgi:hypothetical protein
MIGKLLLTYNITQIERYANSFVGRLLYPNCRLISTSSI